MRNPRSGNTDAALTTSAAGVVELLGSAITPDRHFWLRELWCYNSHAATDGVLTLWDHDEGAGPDADTERYAVPVLHGVTTHVTFAAPGLRFFINICAAVSAGTVAIYQAGCTGYEEGAT